jgi:RecQ family ATP-dependent DNA helicase
MNAAIAVPDASIDARLAAVLQQFGFTSLSVSQDTLIRASIAGQDVLGVLPTGGGKSACYQIPGVVTGEKTIVISPLIALQDDQVRALRDRGVRAFAYHSNLDEVRRNAVRYYYKHAPQNEGSFLYVSPELLLTEQFQKDFKGVQFDRLAVDEAHCVSTWGDGFRPDYQRISIAKERMLIPITSAFTATIDAKIEADIKSRLPLRQDMLKVSAEPMRENLKLLVEKQPAIEGESTVVRGKRRFARLLKRLTDERFKGPTIVYCRSQEQSARLFLKLRKMKAFLRKHGYTPYVYHAAVSYGEKEEALRGFKSDAFPLVFATSAFGMGIDRADVRQIIHYNTPITLIDYAQQIGRGGRDGRATLCTTFHDPDWLSGYHAMQVHGSLPDYIFTERVLGSLLRKLSKQGQKRRTVFTIAAYVQGMRHMVEASDELKNKKVYLEKVRTSLELLRKAGLVADGALGVVAEEIVPGSRKQERLIEATQMRERMLVRERSRLLEFFNAEKPDQTLLWEILKRA